MSLIVHTSANPRSWAITKALRQRLLLAIKSSDAADYLAHLIIIGAGLFALERGGGRPEVVRVSRPINVRGTLRSFREHAGS